MAKKRYYDTMRMSRDEMQDGFGYQKRTTRDDSIAEYEGRPMKMKKSSKKMESGAASQLAKDMSKDMFPYLGGSWLTFEPNEMAGMPRGYKIQDVPTAPMGLNRAVPGNIMSINEQIREDHESIVAINTNPRKI